MGVMARVAFYIGITMTRREAFIALNLLPEIGPGRVRLLLQCFSNPQDALGASVESLMRVPRLGAAGANVLHDWEKHCDLLNEERRCQRAGVSIVTCEDVSYPSQLREIHDPPICLYLRGDLMALQKSGNALAVVGSRTVTQYGVASTRLLASDAARAGWTIVSGLARGIDTIAHTAALDVGGCTIAVLGSGLEHLYPQENLGLARRIAENGGAVISEFSLGTRPERHNFPMRNRIISGLSRGTLVVEAGLQSGSLITAAQAIDQGRTVFAVPGRIDSPYARGCNALLKDGARLVESYDDIRDEFSILPGLSDTAIRREQAQQDALAQIAEIQLNPLEYRLWCAIGDGDREIDALVDELDVPASSVLGALLTMEIQQVIRQLPGKLVCRVPDRRVKAKKD